MGIDKSKIYRKFKFEEIEHPEFGPIRTAIIKGQRWYFGNDIGRFLKYKRSHDRTYDIAKRYPNDRVYVQYQVKGRKYKTITSVLSINAVFHLLNESEMPNADEFREWLAKSIYPQVKQRSYNYKLVDYKPLYNKALLRINDLEHENEFLRKVIENSKTQIRLHPKKGGRFDEFCKRHDLDK